MAPTKAKKAAKKASKKTAAKKVAVPKPAKFKKAVKPAKASKASKVPKRITSKTVVPASASPALKAPAKKAAKKAAAKKVAKKRVGAKTVVPAAGQEPTNINANGNVPFDEVPGHRAPPGVNTIPSDKPKARTQVPKGQDAKSAAQRESNAVAKRDSAAAKKASKTAGKKGAVTSKTVVSVAESEAAKAKAALGDSKVTYMGKDYASIKAAALETGVDEGVLASRLSGAGENMSNLSFGSRGSSRSGRSK